ncbi:hypothetical protein C7U89_28540 [Bradyrhizobium sp. WBOS4]|nr:hypothetical protein [Bradyrhizobium sp. WBOS8]MDD1586852.1 hypothetical protein [Bradyrhizobium sp. WBOS4]UUO49370.1 hypothetical protein DCM78_22130 [Bradyrhizobium sp. WBOS04]UUO63183.1 hypothetical protein DCM80_31000 [Bradyrhizobium sp. WBOS08]
MPRACCQKACCQKARCPLPFAGLLEAMMAGKFEWQFKYRDEADVNAPARRPACGFKKLLICRHFCDSSDFVYRRILGDR